MTDYNKIKNPITGRSVSIYGKLGKNILANYIEKYQTGGAGASRKRCPLVDNGQGMNPSIYCGRTGPYGENAIIGDHCAETLDLCIHGNDEDRIPCSDSDNNNLNIEAINVTHGMIDATGFIFNKIA